MRLSGVAHSNSLAWAGIIGCAAVLQLFLLLNAPYPYVIDSGDNGSILYIIAYWLKPAAFAQDALLGVPGSTDFYQAALMWPNYLLGLAGFQLGLFFVILCFPMVLAQMAGFYLLGRRVFGRQALALALAFITLPVVFTLSGDLWGMDNSPLMRTAYGAALPWLLLVLLGRPRPFLLMVLAGLASYLHLPSGPPVALGLLIASFWAAGPNWGRAVAQHVGAGLLYLAILAPYVMIYRQGFAAGDIAALGIYKTNAYGNLSIALEQLFSLRGPDRMAILLSRVPGLWAVSFLVVPMFAAIYLLGLGMVLALGAAAVWPWRQDRQIGNLPIFNGVHR